MASMWPWFVLAGLGIFHGLNPAMGWLFAVALGMHSQSRAVVLTALIPIAIGHALAIGLVVFAAAALGFFVDPQAIRILAGVLLIGWGVYHLVQRGHHRARFGMQIGMIGLGVWSFLMATAHGAGLMLLPALIPLGIPAGHDHMHAMPVSGSLPIALAAVAVHTLAMLATTAVVAMVVYEWVGVGFLRRGWINVDLLWAIALIVAGLILIVT
jgi:hypothetical protein